MPFWKGRGLGSGLRTLHQGRDRWGIYSTKGGYILSSLRFLSPTRGTEGGVKTIEKAWLEVELPLERETEGFEKYLL